MPWNSSFIHCGCLRIPPIVFIALHQLHPPSNLHTHTHTQRKKMQFKSINSVNPIDPNDAVRQSLPSNPQNLLLTSSYKPAPVTPCKRQCSPSPKEEESTTSPSLANDTQIPTPAPTPTKKARVRKTSPSKRSGTLGPLPASYAESGEEDKLLLKMKEVEGKPWTAIQDALEEMTGSKLVGASLRKRYSKMKANFVVFAKEDVCFFFFFFLSSLP